MIDAHAVRIGHSVWQAAGSLESNRRFDHRSSEIGKGCLLGADWRCANQH
jgi:hypothetical protein